MSERKPIEVEPEWAEYHKLRLAARRRALTKTMQEARRRAKVNAEFWELFRFRSK